MAQLGEIPRGDRKGQAGAGPTRTSSALTERHETMVACAGYAFASDTEFQGFWNGALETGPVTLRLVLKIARATNGDYTATMDSLNQGSKDIPAARVSFNAPNVEVEWPALRAFFHGQLEKGRLVGFWQQGPADFPLEFGRTNRVTGASTA